MACKIMIHRATSTAIVLLHLFGSFSSVMCFYACAGGGSTCCDLSSFYHEGSHFKTNLHGLLAKVKSSRKDREQSPLVRVSQFLSSPIENPTSSAEPAYGAWLCVENQTPDDCQACIEGLINNIQSGMPDLPACKLSTGVEAIASNFKCRMRYDKFQFWNPSDTCQPLCCSAERIGGGLGWSYGGNVVRAWNKTQQKLKDEAARRQLSYRDFYDSSGEAPLLELEGRRPTGVFIGYDCAPWVTAAQCLKCVESLVLSLDHWYLREGERCDDTIGITANDDHEMYHLNPHEEPGAYPVRGSAGDWPKGQWPRGSCKLFFDRRPHPDSLYSD